MTRLFTYFIKQKIEMKLFFIIQIIINFNTMSSTLSSFSNCCWCNCIMQRGEKTWILKPGKFDCNIKKLLSVICGNKQIHCPGTKMLIMSFLSSGQKPYKETYCTDCGTINIKFSRSGRTIFTPLRLVDETFITGSGVGGCDQYDHGYDDGKYYDYEREDIGNLDNFIVSDYDIREEYSKEESEEEISDWSEESDESDWSNYE